MPFWSRPSLAIRCGAIITPSGPVAGALRCRGQRIESLGVGVGPRRGDHLVELRSCTLLPGLINSHDHLEFGLFARLGNRIYANYVEWAEDVQDRNRSEIADALRIWPDTAARRDPSTCSAC